MSVEMDRVVQDGNARRERLSSELTYRLAHHRVAVVALRREDLARAVRVARRHRKQRDAIAVPRRKLEDRLGQAEKVARRWLESNDLLRG